MNLTQIIDIVNQSRNLVFALKSHLIEYVTQI